MSENRSGGAVAIVILAVLLVLITAGLGGGAFLMYTRAQRERAVAMEAMRRAEVARAEALEQAARSHAERARAEAVQEFLQSIVTAGEPGSPTVKVDEVLNTASDRLNSGVFADRPEVAADLHVALGNAYRRAGKLDAAEKHLTTAVEMRTAALGSDHADVKAARDALDAVRAEKSK